MAVYLRYTAFCLRKRSHLDYTIENCCHQAISENNSQIKIT
nr:MAG TPA: hypothetical protein [Caudoviricetes sp.]